jgi:hypothetical protein
MLHERPRVLCPPVRWLTLMIMFSDRPKVGVIRYLGRLTVMYAASKTLQETMDVCFET